MKNLTLVMLLFVCCRAAGLQGLCARESAVNASTGKVSFREGYFYRENGERYFPLGYFGCYFADYEADDQQGRTSQHGDNLLEFQRMPVSVWRKFFGNLREQGYTALRLFPRGDSSGSAWEGLDIGGRLNRPLLETMFKYFEVAAEYGIKIQLCLFSQMECSFYCQPDTRRYWGSRLYTPEEIENAPAFQQRFLKHPEDLVTYNDYFSDPDVRACNKQFLDEIIPLVAANPNVFLVEISNEIGWAGPHANPLNTFRWEITSSYLDWIREMVAHIHALAPGLPVCISNPGVGLLGHDPAQWSRESGIDIFSMHLYPDICGHTPGSDFAQMADATLRYAQTAAPVMYGEWQLTGDPGRDMDEPAHERCKQLLTRDMVWFTMLSGAPGCMAWRAPGYGEYAPARDVFTGLNGRNLTRAAAPLKINIGSMTDKMIALADGGFPVCQFTEARWCPDRSAPDGKHRFCAKAESPEYKALLRAESWSLETGADYVLTQVPQEGIPLLKLTKKDFTKQSVPMNMPEGYQMKTMQMEHGHTILIYLRNYRQVPVRQGTGSEQFDLFALRTQKAVPLTLNFRLDGKYKLKILDLDTREWMEPQAVERNSAIGMGITSHDYVLVLTR
jgi:hypothetical protein